MLKNLKQIKSIRHILPVLMTILTRHPRYRPEILWSDCSWTHNIFRVYEMFFWRRHGIRIEAESTVQIIDGKRIAGYKLYTIEAMCAWTETFIRRFFTLPKFAFVRVYSLAPVANAGQDLAKGFIPYINFAIAFDAGESTNEVASLTHTCTGSNLLLWAAGFNNNGFDSAMTASFNSVAMSKVGGNASNCANMGTNENVGLFALAAPATGAKTLAYTGGTPNAWLGGSSFTGCAQTGIPDATAYTSTASGATATGTVTVVANNSFMVMVCRNQGSTYTMGTNTSSASTGNYCCLSYSTAAVGTGSQSLVNTFTSSAYGFIVASFAPVAAAQTFVFWQFDNF